MTLLTAQGISDVALALLRRRIVLPRTFTQIPGSDFDGSNGDTITVRVPVPSAARTQTAGQSITYDDIDEVPVEVTMTHLYHGKLISDEEANMELEDFARQITRVQVAAVAIGAEDLAAAAINDLSVDATIEFAATASDADTKAVVLAARERLIENDCPPDELFAAVAPDIASRVLSFLTPVNESGSDSALRRAIIGQLYGFTFVESNGLDAGTASFYHRSAFCFANKTPKAPRSGSAESGVANDGGVGMRSILQYVPDKLSEASVLSTFAGASVVLDEEGDSPSDFASPNDQLRVVKVGIGST